MISEVVEAKPYHCGQMARQLREDHRAVLIGAGLDIHRNLRDTFDMSSVRRAWMLDGKLMMIGGIEGPIASSEGMVWIALSGEAEKYPFRAVMIMKDHLQTAMLTRRALLAIILKGDARSVKFAHRIGFEPRENMSVCGMDAVLMRFGQ